MRAPILLLGLAVLVGGCSGADDPDRTTSTLTCANGQSCTLDLAADGGFIISLQSNNCIATQTVVRLSKPDAVAQTLMSDACVTPQPVTEWDFSPPTHCFEAGTSIAIEITADQFSSPPSLGVTEPQAQDWIVRFEDGFDTDQDDLILRVQAIPAGAECT